MTDDITRDAQQDARAAAINGYKTVTATCDGCGDEIALTAAEANLSEELYCGGCR